MVLLAMERVLIMSTDCIMVTVLNPKQFLMALHKAINASINLLMAFISLHYSHSNIWLKQLSTRQLTRLMSLC